MNKQSSTITLGVALLSVVILVFNLSSNKVDGPEAPLKLTDNGWSTNWPKGAEFDRLPLSYDWKLNITLKNSDDAIKFLLNANRNSHGLVNKGIYFALNSKTVSFGNIEVGLLLERDTVKVNLPLGKPVECVVRRRGEKLSIEVDNKNILVAHDRKTNGGDLGLATLGGPGIELRAPKRSIEEPNFEDSFMRTSDEPGPWNIRSGDWKIETLATPSMSANAFSCRLSSKGDAPAIGTTGSSRWTNYRIKAAVRGKTESRLGVAFAYLSNNKKLTTRGMPSWLSFDGRRFVGVPTKDDVGSSIITVKDGQKTVQQFKLCVLDAPPKRGSILQETWTRVIGNLDKIHAAKNLPPPTMSRFITEFDTIKNAMERYNTRVRGYLHPPVSGEYVFMMASDEEANLYLSTNEDKKNAQRIIRNARATAIDDWKSESKPIHLEANNEYYIEAIMRDNEGDDHLRVGWRMADGNEQKPIAAKHLSVRKSSEYPESTDGEQFGFTGEHFSFDIYPKLKNVQYMLFRWNPDESQKGAELLYITHDENGDINEELLAKSELCYKPNQWYKLDIELALAQAKVFVDDFELLSAHDKRITTGAFGLWADGKSFTEFDDVKTEILNKFEEDFTAGNNGVRARFETIGGEWNIDKNGLHLDSKMSSLLITGVDTWRNMEASATVSLTHPAGLVIAYRGVKNYIRLVVTPTGFVRLERVSGNVKKLHTTRIKFEDTSNVKLRLKMDRGVISGFVNDKHVVSAHEEELITGRAGLYFEQYSKASFKSFALRPVVYEPPFRQNIVFQADNIMSSWASEWADWYQGPKKGKSAQVYWHRAMFPSDIEFTMLINELPKKDGRLVLSIAKDGKTPGGGYSFDISNLAAGQKPKLSLTRNSVLIRNIDTIEKAPSTIGIRRVGGLILAHVDGNIVAEYKDDKPLSGAKTAFLSDNVSISPTDIHITGGNIFDYNFSKAPTDWRVAVGRWDLRNRWQCDPRWSFFIGTPKDWPRPKKEDYLVAVWNKRKFKGDIAIEFYCGPKMTRERGERYQYARDFNLTIAADGQHLDSGYTFSFSGFNCKKTAILKNGKILAETTQKRALYPRGSMNMHQRWFKVRVTKNGDKIKYTVHADKKLVVSLEAVDPDPINEGQVALWSYDNGYVVARMRVSSEATEGFESIDVKQPEHIRTFYDHTQKAAGGK